jgi:hypothetical protein
VSHLSQHRRPYTQVDHFRVADNPARSSVPLWRKGGELASQAGYSNFRSQMLRTEILQGWLSISKPMRPG